MDKHTIGVWLIIGGLLWVPMGIPWAAIMVGLILVIIYEN